jgi:general secretion pathway protein D
MIGAPLHADHGFLHECGRAIHWDHLIEPDDMRARRQTLSARITRLAMLRKIDILPLQVRIDAVIAEVQLNDNLQYGTQFFFKSGGLNGILSNATQSAALNLTFPGFFIGGHGQGGAPFAINALQAVTKVNVLSSPELLVLDNQPARLQVGNVVPYLTQSSQSLIVANAPVVNSVNYQQTGVVMEVTPRVNSGGLVTPDILQDVSEVSTTIPTPGINSPTFNDRNVTSRVVVQDGQTVGLAGLIPDNASTNNQGIPWLKDVPLLGFLAGNQNNTRQRSELLILVTPHVMHDQRDAQALTEDLRDQVINAAAVPDTLNGLRPSGSADPGARMRQKLKLQPGSWVADHVLSRRAARSARRAQVIVVTAACRGVPVLVGMIPGIDRRPGVLQVRPVPGRDIGRSLD